VYLIDKLALRAGGEKDEDLADTVGCCTLRVGHVIHIEQTEATPCSIKFDFLGKDSIRYEQTHEVDPKVYASMKRMKAGKSENDDLFDLIDPPTVNTHLQGLMEGLTIKVFRTYNASITLHNLLQETKEGTTQQKKAQYDAANKEVAILCNHQKGVSKAHDTQMAKMRDKTDAMQEELNALVKDKLNKEKNAKKIASLTERLEKAKLNMNMKEELKTVSLGTSKINYLDPRITIAWCKKWEMPINLVYTKALMEKFNWAMEVEPEFMF
jgi:DNA topoisomerase-1